MEYMSREDYCEITCGKENREGYKTCHNCSMLNVPSADVQPVDVKEILKHLDSLMICVGNAYNTSHGLLQSDMEFIEKQEKIIKGLLSNETIKG